MTVSLTSRVLRNPDIVHSEIDEEVVMMSAETGRYYSLQDVGADIWRRLEEPTLLSDVCDALMGRYRVERPTCEVEVLDFVRKLHDEGLVRIA